MKLIVGLGNPGSDHAGTRHNIGFMAADAAARALGAGNWQAKFQGEMAEARLDGEKLILLKPMTYMNLSGQAVGEAARFFKIAPDDIIVFYDELDLAPGKLRVKKGGGTAGHNGLKSLQAHIGPDFWRVRLGIGHPGEKHLVTNHVLGRFAKADAAWLEPLMQAIGAHLPLLVAGDHQSFQSKVAQAVNDARQRGAAASHAGAAGEAEGAPAPAAAGRREEKAPASPFDKLRRLLGKD